MNINIVLSTIHAYSYTFTHTTLRLYHLHTLVRLGILGLLVYCFTENAQNCASMIASCEQNETDKTNKTKQNKETEEEKKNRDNVRQRANVMSKGSEYSKSTRFFRCLFLVFFFYFFVSFSMHHPLYLLCRLSHKQAYIIFHRHGEEKILLRALAKVGLEIVC